MRTREQMEARIVRIQAKIDSGEKPEMKVELQKRIVKVQARIDALPEE
jgi:hypothetical protein